MPLEAPVAIHHHFAYTPLPERAPVRWPGGDTLSLSVLVLVEHLEPVTPEGFPRLNLPHGAFSLPDPGVVLRWLSIRDYGHRVGVFRVLDALCAAGVRPSVAIDAMTAERHPFLVDQLRAAGSEFVAHGFSVSRPLTSELGEDAERALIGESLDRLTAALGQRPRGWLSPEQSESERTPRLLAEAGLSYVCDWANDEQPYGMAGAGDIVSVPTAAPFDDGVSLWTRSTPPEVLTSELVEAGRVLAADGIDSGRSLVLVVRPWITGKPHRIAAFERALLGLVATPGVWTATTGEVADAFRAQEGGQA